MPTKKGALFLLFLIVTLNYLHISLASATPNKHKLTKC